MTEPLRTSKWQYYSALVVSAFLLLIPAFYNYYPLVNPDTGTYLASGFKPDTPIDRPITYGILVRLFSLNGVSLWLAVFAQAYTCAWLIFKIVRRLCDSAPFILKSLLITLFLSVCSQLSWEVSQVQPDMYTSVAVLCIIAILAGEESSLDTILFYFIFFVSVATHLSHPLLFFGILAGLFFLKRMFTEKAHYGTINKKVLILLGMSLASIAIMGSALSKSKHVYFVGSLLEKGLLKKYLDVHCVEKKYQLCTYKDGLPDKSDDLLWDYGSVLYKMGGWSDTKKDFNAIIRDVLTEPAYLKLYVAATARQTFQQLGTFAIGIGNDAFTVGTNVNQCMAAYMPGEFAHFNAARQNKGALSVRLNSANLFLAIVVVASLLVVLSLLLFQRRKLSPAMLMFFIVSLVGILFNSMDCAAFGVVNDRYGSKTIWLLPFCVIVYFVVNYCPKLSDKNKAA